VKERVPGTTDDRIPLRIPVIDGHNDAVGAICGLGGKNPRSFLERSNYGHIDLPRALEGGLAGGFFAVWIPPDPASMTRSVRAGEPGAGALPPAIDQSFALKMAVSLTALLIRAENQSNGLFKFVRNTRELRSCLEAGTLAGILHFEGAEAIDPQLHSLEVFHRAGLRSLGLVWSRPNAFAEGVPLLFPGSPDIGAGLTPYGKDLVRACNRSGILVDLSHLNERGFWDVADLTDAPLVATHSNAHALTPSSRNLTNAQLDAIAGSGGVVGVCFSTAFSREDGKRDPNTPLSVLIRHFVYIANRIGVDHVAFGSDFDGTEVPAEIGDVTGLPRLLAALASAGFNQTDLRKMAFENWLRVLDQTWKDT
jgi:membrane dipeptidase